MRHKLDEPVRAYLLGTLNDDHAAALEEKYFVDADFLGEVRNSETKLIQDYLANRLSASERRLFVKRYLGVPELARCVERVRQESANSRQTGHRPRSTSWHFSLAGAMLSLLLAAGFVYWREQPRRADPRGGLPQIARDLPVFTLRLSPGTIKGATAQSVAIARRPAGTMVRLELDLAGENLAADYQARLMAIDADGHRGTIWTSGIRRPVTAAGGGVLTVDVAASLLLPGDYLVEVGPPDRGTLETYLFRVNAIP
jgi:hypothetical protein